ncbi:MAG: Transposase IS200 like protein [Lentisphaerae bacterium ADurb.BinA184]|nr:MAG: Transposase IS200 like protein [Lentisphaerae bacterium ADurb.BinA184]
MPRCARIKPDDTGTYYHLANRIAGMPGELPFGDVEKEKMISLIKELSRFFTIEVLAFQAMGNHLHIVCHAPAELLAAQATATRYNDYYHGVRPTLAPDDPQCLAAAKRMRDISQFMGCLQQRFTSWYNRTRPLRRRGTLWAQRFKSVVLERETALWRCLCYVEMNAVRAGLTADPGDYRFGSWGQWCATGHHPFGENLCRRLVAYEGETARAHTLEEIRTRFRIEFARLSAAKAGAGPAEIEAEMEKAAKTPSFVVQLDRRVRYWTDGLIIGGKAFVRETATRVLNADQVRRHRLEPARGPHAGGLYAYRRLHTVPG